MANDTLTPNLKLVKVAADRLNWTELMNKNMSVIDAAINAYFNINNLQGVWTNSTDYAKGDSVIDEVSAVVYVAQVAHTSATIPTTFAQERAAHAEYWAVYSSPARARGEWQANTQYALNDFVTSGPYFAICIEAHTSDGSFTADLAVNRWSVLIDLSDVTFAPDPTGHADQFPVVNADGDAYTLKTASNALNLLGFTAASKPIVTLTTVSAIRDYLGVDAAPMITAGMTVAEIRAIIDTNNIVYFGEQLTLTETLDLSNYLGKTFISLVSGKPLIISSAAVGMRVGGNGRDFALQNHSPQFYGEWFISFNGVASDNTTAIFIESGTYRLHFDCVYHNGWGRGILGTKGDIRTFTINRLKQYDFTVAGVEIFSSDPIKEIDSIFFYEVEGNSRAEFAPGTHFSFGPSIGSGGKVGGVITNGICYRQNYIARFWAVIPIETIEWADDVLTLNLKYHSTLVAGDNVFNGGCDVAAINNMTSTPRIALPGTGGKVIKVSLVGDPGAYLVPGYFSYDYRIVPAGFNNYERPRKFTFMDVSGRAQNLGGFRVEDGGNLSWLRCVVDDAGVSDPQLLWVEGSWAANVVTYKTYLVNEDGTRGDPAPHELTPGDYFNIRRMQPSAYNVSIQSVTTPDAYTVTAAMTTDPGTMLRRGEYYKPLQLDCDAWYFGPNAGAYSLELCEAHENYRSAVYDDRMTNERSIIRGCRFYNQSYGLPDPPDPVADMYFRPGRGNMTITDNIVGAGDTWRFGSRSFAFTGLPSEGDWISIAKDSTVAPRFFVFAATADPDASQPNVAIGATVAETAANLANAINIDSDVSSDAVQAFATNALLDDNEAADRTLLVRNVPGAIGNEFLVVKSGANITISPAGGTFGGGTGTATSSYAIMNIKGGEHGNVIERNQFESHTVAETNMPDDAPPTPIAPNLLDNGDMSIDQRNEGGSVTITSSATGTPSVDRWFFTRGTGGSDPTAQRVVGDGRAFGIRATGAAGVTSVIARQRWESARCATVVGQICTFSVEVKSSSATTVFLRIAYANATDNFAGGVTNITNKQFVINSDITRISTTVLMPANSANGLEFSIRLINGLGATETLDIQAAKFEISGVATEFQDPAPDNNLFACQRYYRKSFILGTVPAQNAGTSGAIVGPQVTAGAVAQQFKSLVFSPPMWKAPTITLYNPSAANAQIRDTTTNADWSATASASITANGFTINGTGPAGSAAGDVGAIHYVADASLG